MDSQSGFKQTTSPTRVRRPSKRIKLEESHSPEPASIPIKSEYKGASARNAIDVDSGEETDRRLDVEEDDQHNCSICLQPLVDRTVIPSCSHEFCFECILVWSEQSRRCPLCSQAMADYLIHRIRSKYDYQKHYLNPLRTSPSPLRPNGTVRRPRERRERPWGRRQLEEMEEADELERAIAKRRWIYEHGLYAKHVASNAYTRYKPYPTPTQFSASPDLISRTTMFLRRELRVWIGLDVEFLTTFIISLMKSIDIRSESAVKLLAEFLDMDTDRSGGGDERQNAQHFAHELYSYLRSPFRDLTVYDSVVQYDAPSDLPPPIEFEQTRRWRATSGSRSRSPSQSRSRSRHRSGRYRSRSMSTSRPPRSPDRREDMARTIRRQDDARPSGHHSRRSSSYQRRSARSRSRGRYYGQGKRRQSSRSLSSSRSVFGPERPERPPTPDRKGKRRADSDVDPEVTPEDEGQSNVEPIASPKANDAPAVVMRNLRPPRNRGLLESVQAHLGSNSRSRSNMQKRNAEPAEPVSITTQINAHMAAYAEEDNVQSPTLAARLSNEIEVQPSKFDTSAPVTNIAHPENGAPAPARRYSAPEIMARTRARLARLKNEPVAGISPDDVRSGHDSEPPQTPSPSSSTTKMDNRAKLMDRLEDAKRQVRVGSTAAEISGPTLSKTDSTSKPPVDTISQQAERKLRQQAHLRIKLAVAKRTAVDRPSCNSPLDAGLEESLRAKLKGRQV